MKRGLKDFILRICNVFIPKIEKSIFVNVGTSVLENCEDIINCGSSNVLSFINQMIKTSFDNRIVIYIGYLFEDRMEKYHEIKKEALKNNIDVRFFRVASAQSNKFTIIKMTIKKFFLMFRTKIWLVWSGDHYLLGKLKCQKIINMNYFISCKNDFVTGENYRWNYLDGILTTSMMASTVISAQTGVKYDSCIELGFPRNDTLFSRTNRDEVLSWLSEELGYVPNKIFVYAPTYRDYEKSSNETIKRSLFGYSTDFLEDFLKKNQYCLVCKLHNLTAASIIHYPTGVVKFKYTFEFSFYDLMAISDCVITDYSSLGYDFLLLNRPIIYNLYDYEKYVKDRGMSYEPYDEFCPGRIVTSSEEMFEAMKEVARGIDKYEEKRQRLIRVFHKYPDGNSAKRFVEYLSLRFELK